MTKHPLFVNPNSVQREVMERIDDLKTQGQSRIDIESAIFGDEWAWDEPQQLFGYCYLEWLFHEEGYSGVYNDMIKAELEAEEEKKEFDYDPEKNLDFEYDMDRDRYLEYVRKRIKYIADRIKGIPGGAQMVELFQEAGRYASLKMNRRELEMKAPPRVNHLCIVGNANERLVEAARLYAEYCHRLGLVDSGTVVETSLTRLVGQTVSSEADNTRETLGGASDGTVIFQNAHELNNPHKKYNDSGSQVIQTLEDILAQDCPGWMLILIGESAGVEALLSSHPRLKAHFPRIVYMKDASCNELMNEARHFCEQYDLSLTEGAETRLQTLLSHAGTHATESNYVRNLFSDKIYPAACKRIYQHEMLNDPLLRTIEAEDIPSFSYQDCEALKELDELVGLGEIKARLRDYLDIVKLADRRRSIGQVTQMPRLHMVFLGNPGTGKTTVARIVGKVLASWGILSRGQVICTEKSELVGEYVGETEVKMRNLIARATGNVLFIDEAYQLVEGAHWDHGRIVLDSLLTHLGSDNLDMVVILAGYTAPMKRLLESNEGIESRFPNVFNFEDYTTDELVSIGKLMISKQGFMLTEGAEKNLRAVIEEESEKPSSRFGNGRFVSNLIQNEILSALGKRTGKMAHPSKEELSTILTEDVIIGRAQKNVVFDDAAIDAALERLDRLAGLDNVKQAIHNFVQSARYLHSIGEPFVGKGLLSWRFIGNSGTGKSTVAEILAAILKGMHLISNSHITEIKGERIIDVPDGVCEAVLRDAVKKSCNGLIFIDLDDPSFIDFGRSYHRYVEQVRLRLKEMTIAAGGECALVLADVSAPNLPVVEELAEGGVPEFDHTLVFKDFTPDELYGILCLCLEKFDVSFSPAAEKHMRAYLEALHTASAANARTMKLMSRTIYQQVILRETGLTRRPKSHQVQLNDIEMFKWNRRKGRIGY